MAERVSEIREGARRQHYMVGLYASLFCWLNAIDGCRIERTDIERLLGLQRIRDTRIEWLKEDLQCYFGHVDPRVDLDLPGKPWSVIYLSREPLTDESITNLRELALWPTLRESEAKSNQLLQMFYESLPDEKVLTSVLTLLAAGQLSPGAIPGLLGDAS